MRGRGIYDTVKQAIQDVVAPQLVELNGDITGLRDEIAGEVKGVCAEIAGLGNERPLVRTRRQIYPAAHL